MTQNFDGSSTVLLKAAREKEEDVEVRHATSVHLFEGKEQVEALAEIPCTEGEQVDDMSAFFGNKVRTTA